jgi:hypothetical protein
MNNKIGIFSFGYWGWGNRVPELRRTFLQHNKAYRGRGLIWVDIRIRRTVRAAGFNGDTPRKLLGPGSYVWLRNFGNTQILNGQCGVQIKNYKDGFKEFQQKVLAKAKRRNSDTILFCACENLSQCHRNNVMNWLKRQKIKGAKVHGEFLAQFNPCYFYSPSDEPRFKKWCKHNPGGYYLNCHLNKEFTLHHADCHHIGDLNRPTGADNWRMTSVPKKCSRSRPDLLKWAAKLGAHVTSCSSCHKPT